MCIDVCEDMSVDLCIDMCIDMCIDICMDLYVGTSLGMFIGTFGDVCTRHVSTRGPGQMCGPPAHLHAAGDADGSLAALHHAYLLLETKLPRVAHDPAVHVPRCRPHPKVRGRPGMRAD